MIDLVIGAGQGGCRIAKQFSAVFDIPGRYLNLADVDLTEFYNSGSVPQSHILAIDEGGTGRDPEVGEELANDYASDIETFVQEAIDLVGVKSKFQSAAVCIGGGGGSGCGMLFRIVNKLIENEVDVLLVYTLPQKKEGLPAKPNALKTLNKVIEKYVGRSVSIEKQVTLLLVDNDFCLSRYGKKDTDISSDYWQRVNVGIAKALRSFFNLTDAEKMKAYSSAGYGALDYHEFMRIFFFKQGLIDIRDTIFSEPDASEFGKLVRTSSLFFGSLDIRTTKAYIVSIAIPEFWKATGRDVNEFIAEVFDKVSRSTKTPFVLRSSYFSPNINKAHVRLLLAGMNKSHGLDKILKQTVKDVEKFKQKESMQQMDLSDIDF